MEFLHNLNEVLKKAAIQDFKAMNNLFEKGHLWDWYGPEHLKTLLYLHQSDDGTYDVHQISQAIAVKDAKGEPWPGPVMIEGILRDLEEVGLIRVTWGTTGIVSNQPFKVTTESLLYNWHLEGDFWKNLNGAIQEATYKDLQALRRLYRETDLLDQPPFFLRVLSWSTVNGSGKFLLQKVKDEFDDLLHHAWSLHDSRDAESGLTWARKRRLLGITWGMPGEPFELDIRPLSGWGFTINAEVTA
ncbi:MAG: hypothetical protein A4E63_02013 [Syntrophorhabdus sp. PtaU1.Bin050]|nr:MAG: hypothetical protein A4E63_02013 [Syntrophorhabdus sp. PtaU1.Bin050]